ncbi:hypothetical protein GCM10008967_25730 [Bacillus carboniphilus]|uniref:Uncharacterized protein n=1 Tax=Bacillus carboniphilus TaxID=86663 RepID=A0ABP3G557_9BACI
MSQRDSSFHYFNFFFSMSLSLYESLRQIMNRSREDLEKVLGEGVGEEELGLLFGLRN